MMKRNIAYMIVGAVAVALVVVGYQYYQASRHDEGVEIKLDGNGISIQKQ